MKEPAMKITIDYWTAKSRKYETPLGPVTAGRDLVAFHDFGLSVPGGTLYKMVSHVLLSKRQGADALILPEEVVLEFGNDTLFVGVPGMVAFTVPYTAVVLLPAVGGLVAKWSLRLVAYAVEDAAIPTHIAHSLLESLQEVAECD